MVNLRGVAAAVAGSERFFSSVSGFVSVIDVPLPLPVDAYLSFDRRRCSTQPVGNGSQRFLASNNGLDFTLSSKVNRGVARRSSVL